MNQTALYRSLIRCLDLVQFDKQNNGAALCHAAITPYGPVAAVSVAPPFVSEAKGLVKDASLSALINFPEGGEDTLTLEREAAEALEAGADEISHVMPYQAFAEGRPGFAETQMVRIKRVCGSKPYKAVLAADALKDKALIYEAANAALNAGADFLTTSPNAAPLPITQQAVEILLSVLVERGSQAGLHIIGGIKTVSEAVELFKTVQKLRGDEEPHPDLLRLSAPGLRQALIHALEKEGKGA